MDESIKEAGTEVNLLIRSCNINSVASKNFHYFLILAHWPGLSKNASLYFSVFPAGGGS